MSSWFNSRRDAVKIVGAWLGCLLVVCGAWLASILGFLESARQAKSVRLTASRIRVYELEARRAEKDFILRSLADESFFREGRSEYLERHKATVETLRGEIQKLGGEVPSDLNRRARELLEMVRHYEQGFRELVAAYRSRGFRGSGHEGSLMNALTGLLKAVEPLDSPSLRRAVLILGRNERTFMLQPSNRNAERVAADLLSLREQITRGQTPESIDGVLEAVSHYETAFASCLALEKEIGLTEELGLRGELRKAIHEVEPTVEEILMDAVRADEDANRTLVVGILVACIIMGVLLALAIFFGQAARLQSKRLLQINQQMEEDHRKMLQSERLAAIGQMVAGLAHESRNAFQRTHACLHMLSQQLDDRPEALDLVSRIEDSQDYIHLLYEQVRDYAAPLRVKREATGLAEVVQSAWAQLELVREGRVVHFEQDVDSVDLHCDVDAFSLQQVFRNIFENSLAACGDPVEIKVRYGEGTVDSRSALRISVSDNGSGLNAEQRARIFDPFYTTKTRGTGLGMAIVKRLVEAHGGTIEVRSPDQRGAEIIVSLPRTA